ncbi:MAG TPA: Trm112 family protein [Candidatus Acidoferrales bacterium]|nr:Trm112 family protein [Candidatus Acidoferrales bacterium]
MAISKELLDILVCPACRTPVQLTPDEQGLKCSQCRRVYPIRDGIPTMIVDEARIESQ